MHIIDADKLLDIVEKGMEYAYIGTKVVPINDKGEYDVVSDVLRHLDLYTVNQLKVIRDYIIENRV